MSSIKPGQVYVSADPRDMGRVRVRIVHVFSDVVNVVDAGTGRQSRSIALKRFHADALTASGQPRRTGYVLEAGRGE